MTVKEIMADYLTKNGYVGLINEDAECTCVIDDIMCCGEGSAECEPAYIKKCKPEDCEKCNSDSENCFKESGFRFTTEKPSEEDTYKPETPNKAVEK